MKLKLIALIQLALLSHQALSSQETVMYNSSKIYIHSTDKTNGIMYIDGNLVAGSIEEPGSPGTIQSTSAIQIEDALVILTGHLINDVAKGTAGGTIFTPATPGHAGTLAFRGTQPQQITTSKLLGVAGSVIPSKRYNYINFPHLEINNTQHVTLAAQLAAQTQDINLSKGWLILDSQVADPTLDYDPATGEIINSDQQTVLAHLLVNGQIDYNQSSWNTLPPNQRGFIDVRLKVPTDGDAKLIKSMVGFGSPFKELRADYFMYNTLLAPNAKSFLGKGAITNPETILTAGKGYAVGIDLRGTNPADYLEDPYNETINFDSRSKNGYDFNRHQFNQDPARNSNQIFGDLADSPTPSAYLNETLNTQDIPVALEIGYNYLSNPFTSPLNLDLLLGTGSQALPPWGVWSDAITARPNVSNHVWILTDNTRAEPVGAQTSHESKYSYSYEVAKKVGGTYMGDYDDGENTTGETLIAPLQMFVVFAYTLNDPIITIPASQRAMGTTKFIRNTSTNTPRQDDFILEVRDHASKAHDRVSFVLREAQEIATNGNYRNVSRLVSTSTTNKANTGSGVEQNLNSQLYTQDPTGKALSVQFLPMETSSLDIYHTPPSQEQAISLRALRLKTMNKITEMWLEDKRDNTLTEITPTMIYETTSRPTDKAERFVVHFKRNHTSIEDQPETSNLYAYSEGSTIYMTGFQDSDMGNQVTLYDLNGRQLARTTVDRHQLELSQHTPAGAYLIKMTGSRSQTMKVLHP